MKRYLKTPEAVIKALKEGKEVFLDEGGPPIKNKIFSNGVLLSARTHFGVLSAKYSPIKNPVPKA